LKIRSATLQKLLAIGIQQTSSTVAFVLSLHLNVVVVKLRNQFITAKKRTVKSLL